MESGGLGELESSSSLILKNAVWKSRDEEASFERGRKKGLLCV